MDTESNEDGLFPSSPRLIFEKAPLTQVVAQVQFPTILKIQQTPADFQERIRSAFPLYETGPDIAVAQEGALQLPAQIIQMLKNMPGAIPHRFITAGRDATVTLASSSLALSTVKYTRWEEFLALFQLPLSALVEMYKPPFFTRLGLRYINIIRREAIGLASSSWSSLIRAEVLGELAVPSFESNVETATKQIRLKIPNHRGTVLFQHGVTIVLPQNTRAYALDFDISKEGQIGVADAEPCLGRFHQLAGRAFRWCITPELRDALGPRPAGDDRNTRHAGVVADST